MSELLKPTETQLQVGRKFARMVHQSGSTSQVGPAGALLARVSPSQGSTERLDWSKRGPQGNAPSKFRCKVGLPGSGSQERAPGEINGEVKQVEKKSARTFS